MRRTTVCTAGDSWAPTKDGVSYVLEAYKGEDGWHARRTYE